MKESCHNKETINSNLICEIQEKWPKESGKIFLSFWSFLHRGISARGDLSDIVSTNFQARFINIDYPNEGYNSKEITKQIEEYLTRWNHKIDEIILCWLSFWEIAGRDFLEHINENIKNKIIGRIALSGVFTKEQITTYDKNKKYKDYLISTMQKKIMKNLIKQWPNLDKEMIIKGKLSRNLINTSEFKKRKEKPGYTTRILRHQLAARKGLTPGLIDRLNRILQEENPSHSQNIPIISIYSTNDHMFVDPQKSAEKIKNLSNNPKSRVHKLENAWHACLVEFPEKYNEDFSKIIEELWRKKI